MSTGFRARFAAFAILALVVATGCLPQSAGRSPAASGSPGGPTPSATPSGPTPIPSFVVPTPTPMPAFITYTVVAGDSLVGIARRFDTTGRSIAYWNRATYPSLDPESEGYEPNRIEVGWRLVLIPGVVVDPDDLPEPAPGGTPAPTRPGPGATPAVTPQPGA